MESKEIPQVCDQWDVEWKKQQTYEKLELEKQKINKKRVNFRFVIVFFMSCIAFFQVATVFVVFFHQPQYGHLLMGMISISLPATVGAVGAYLGISAFKKTD